MLGVEVLVAQLINLTIAVLIAVAMVATTSQLAAAFVGNPKSTNDQ